MREKIRSLVIEAITDTEKLTEVVDKLYDLQNVSVECEHPFAYVHTRCMGEINHCLKCGKDL